MTVDKALAAACVMIVMLLPTVAAAAAPTLRPAAVESFFVAPDQPSRLRWDLASGEEFEYVLRDYQQATVASGLAVATGQAIDVSVTLAPGFYEIEFPAAKQSFGVVSLPQFAGAADPFFCVDSALSWLVRDEALREGLLRVLHRGGIGMSRERLSWAQVNPADGSWQWETAMGYDRVRRGHAQQGVAVLDMCHDAPAWMGSVGKYPADLVRTAELLAADRRQVAADVGRAGGLERTGYLLRGRSAGRPIHRVGQDACLRDGRPVAAAAAGWRSGGPP